MYAVNDKNFDSYFAAIAAAKAIDGKVFEVRANGERIERWSPIPKSTKKVIRHVLVNADGSVTPFSKVRR